MGEAFIVSSGKGGVGKTTVAVNLGIALTELGKSVAIIDGSLTTPDVSLHLGVPFHVLTLSHVLKDESHINAATFHHKSGLRVIPGNVHLDVLKEFEGKKFSKILKDLKDKHDFVLVDCAAGLGREAVSAIKNCDKMLVVANPELPSIVSASKTIQTARNLEVETAGIILNRIGRIRKEMKEEDAMPLLHGVPIIGRIPEDKKVMKAIGKSEAVVNCYPKSKTSMEFRKIALSMVGEKSSQKPSLFRKIINFFNF